MLLRIADATRYHRKHPSDDNFWRGSQLEMALEWWETRQPNPAWASRYSDDFALANSFLEESHSAQEKAEAEQESQRKQALRRTQKFAAVLSVALIAALALAFYAWRQQTKAKEQEQSARTQERNARKLTYIANLNLAADAIERDNTSRAFEILARYLPVNDGGEDNNYRSFYWYHLMKACHVIGVTLSGNKAGANSVAWSADGKTLASGSGDKTIKVWDVATGKELRTLSGHKGEVNSVAWSSDGKMLASVSSDKTIKLWDVTSGQELRTLQREMSPVVSVAFSLDGKALACGSYDPKTNQGIIRLWFAASEEDVARQRSK